MLLSRYSTDPRFYSKSVHASKSDNGCWYSTSGTKYKPIAPSCISHSHTRELRISFSHSKRKILHYSYSLGLYGAYILWPLE